MYMHYIYIYIYIYIYFDVVGSWIVSEYSKWGHFGFPERDI